MKHERTLTAFTAVGFAFVIAWGTLGCLVSAFDLTLAYPRELLGICIACALTAAVLLSVRRGSLVLVCIMALGAGWIYRDGRAADGLRQLTLMLGTLYDRAYGWGIPQFAEPLPAESLIHWPLGVMIAMICITVCETVCRRRPATLPVLMSVLPLCSCIVVTDTVPKEGWLLTVMAGLCLLALTNPVRRENPWQGLRLTAFAALPVLLALSLLFSAAPQKDYVNRSALLRENLLMTAERLPQLLEGGMADMTSKFRSKPPRQVDLTALGPRIPYTYPVMTVTAEHSGTLYLRQQDYDIYDGHRWTASEDRRESFFLEGEAPEQITITTESDRPLRFLPYFPAREQILTGGIAENSDGSRTYILERTRLPENWRQTACSSAGTDDGQRQAYLALPEDTRRGAEALLSGRFAPEASHTEKADSIAALVTECARYDLDPSVMPEDRSDFALWFLQEADRGYCVHFATAAAVLLRAADVPARYVTGYMPEAEAGRSVTVTEADAHAWAEYYEPNLGLWLPLEVTPAEPVQEEILLPPAVTEPTQPETRPEQTEAPTESSEPRQTEPEQTQVQTIRPPEPETPEPQQKKAKISPMLLLIPAVMGLLPLQRWCRLTLRRRRMRTGEANRQALKRWQEAERLSRILGEYPPIELQELALKAKFSQYTLTGEELERFDAHMADCIRRMRKRPWWRQLMYRFLYAAY